MKSRFSFKKTSHGYAFGESIGTEKISRRRYQDEGNEGQLRDYLLPAFLFIFFLILIFRLIFLQLFEGGYYRNLANNNRIRSIVIHAPRGIIFDRNGVPLVFNTPGFRQVVNGKTTLIERDRAIELIAKGNKNLEIDSLRLYPYKDTFAHVLGYIGQISQDELKKDKFSDYHSGDLIGKDGIEQEYENKLRGTDGKQLVEVDAFGKTVRTLGQQDPIPGQDIKLTIDVKLQESAFKAMEKVQKGALIISNPKGEILAMVSKPSFDPNLFTHGNYYKPDDTSEYKNLSDVLLDSSNQPLLNRAIAGVYPPGSTFKIITAASGLENNIIDENFQIIDTGILQVGTFSFGNWYFLQYGGTDGEVNVVKAIARSNDIFFYKLAEMVGVDKISEMAKKFGLGGKEGIDLAGEAAGNVPTKEWKEKIVKEPWYLGDTYHYGIGQGYLLATPLQINNMTQVIANQGTLYKPHLLEISNFKFQISNLINEKNFSLIRRGMMEACSTGGVAWPLFEFRVKNSELRIDGKDFLDVPLSSGSADMRKVSIACKTGTAQHGSDETLPHAWITLFAPAYNPQIVITVLAESSGEGSNITAPIAKKVLEEWFTENK